MRTCVHNTVCVWECVCVFRSNNLQRHDLMWSCQQQTTVTAHSTTRSSSNVDEYIEFNHYQAATAATNTPRTVNTFMLFSLVVFFFFSLFLLFQRCTHFFSLFALPPERIAQRQTNVRTAAAAAQANKRASSVTVCYSSNEREGSLANSFITCFMVVTYRSKSNTVHIYFDFDE